MRIHSRVVIGSMVGLGFVMIGIVGLHLGGESVLKVGVYSQLLGAFIGGFLTLLSANTSWLSGEAAALWPKRERLGWTLIGCGCIMWGIGEGFWRYYFALGQNPFPSLADICYASFPPLVLLSLLLSFSSIGRQRLLVLLDSLIAMGSFLAIAWYLLLGSLAQGSGETTLAKFLGLYYPTADVALVSCVIFFLLCRQESIFHTPARRVSLLVLGCGLSLLLLSDSLAAWSVQQNAGIYVDGTWMDLGWPLGMMAIGVAAYLRGTLSATQPMVSQDRPQSQARRVRFGPLQAIPYVLLFVLLTVLLANGLSSTPNQQYIRPVLLMATLLVISLVVVRQILTWQAEQQAVLAYEQQRQVNQLKDELLVSLNHELRTPLTAIAGYVELLRTQDQQLDPASRMAFLDAVAQGCEELLKLVTHLLEAAAMSQGTWSLHCQPCAVERIVEEVVSSLDPRDRQAHPLQMELANQSLVWADPQYVRQVLLNLLSNALKYTPTQTPILLRTSLRGDPETQQVCITVQDVGPGIPPAEQPLLFQKFVRLRRDVAGTIGGSGLGLYLCKQLVEAMGGQIWVESSGKAGEGSCFCFTLPASPPLKPDSHAQESKNTKNGNI
jgi:signal transduction histidine kinase